MKRVTTSILMLVMVFASIAPVMAYAAPNENASKNGSGNNGGQSNPVDAGVYPLHQGNRTGWSDAIDWKGYAEGGESFGLSEKKGETAFVPGYTEDGVGIFWHFVNPDKLGGYADITFVNETGDTLDFEGVESYKNDQHFGVVTGYGWKLMSVLYYPKDAPKKGATQFNLSHTVGGTNPDGDGEFFGMDAFTVLVDAQKEHRLLTYKEIRQREITQIWQKEITPIWGPVFEKKTSFNEEGTLVSRSDSAFGNGHTYVAVDVAKASAAGGVWFEIADSSPKNRATGYYYNVQIADEKLTISFDSRLISANVGAYVVNDSGQFPGNAPSHHGSSVTVDMPAGYGETVYLYFHNEGGIKWYTTGKYEFVRYDFLRNDEYERHLVDEDIIKEKKVGRELVSDEIITDDEYNVEFGLVCKAADGKTVFEGTIANGGFEIVSEGVAPGEYTCILSGNDIEDQTGTVTVVKGEGGMLVFDDIVVTGKTRKQYADEKKWLDDIENESWLEDKENPIEYRGSESKPWDHYATRLN